MAPSDNPKKPPRFPFHIAFPKQGPVRRVVEALPRTQEELDFAIGTKLLGALRHFHGIRLDGLRQGTEPADLMCQDVDGRQVGVQIAEAVDQRLRKLTEMRRTYLGVLREQKSDFADFSGCAVQIVDSGDEPYLPPVASKQGRHCLGQMLVGIKQAGLAIGDLPVGRIIRRKIVVGVPGRTLSLVTRRYEKPSSPDHVSLDWGGSGPSYRTDVPRDIVLSAVRKKLDRYAKPPYRFLLLVYSVDTLLDEDDPDIVEARRLLRRSEHPFDEAWYLYPYAEKALGHLVRLSPIA